MFGSKVKKLKVALAVCALAGSFAAFGGQSTYAFEEYPIGEEQEVKDQHFNVALVYFQPIQMEPEGVMLSPDNDTGFGVGEWIPYLTVHYKFTKQETGETMEGVFMPMNADDGPHYGANLKMLGAGTYDCEFTIDSPYRMNYGLHVDKETGVEGRFWKEPVVLHWTFNYVPRNW